MPATASHFYLGADLGGSSLKIALTDSEGSIITQKIAPIEAKDGRGLVSQIVDGLSTTMTGIEVARLGGIGIGLPGLINRLTNRVEILPFFPDATEYDIVGELNRALPPVPIVVDNDANVA